jgi:hypothetical protein
MKPTLTPELRTTPHRRPALLSASLVVLWLAASAAGFGLLMRHQMTPGAAGQPAHTLPAVLSTSPLAPRPTTLAPGWSSSHTPTAPAPPSRSSSSVHCSAEATNPPPARSPSFK